MEEHRLKMSLIISCKKEHINWVLCLHLNLLFFFFFFFSSPHLVFCGQIVKTLPGYYGELPFSLETGYITVAAESQLFYYFIKSEGNPKEDPLLLWYSGGPGCSTLNGLIYEIGPLAFNITEYEGGTPPLEYYRYSWTQTANILFVDAPVGTGFSYPTNRSAFPSSDTKSALQTYEFLLKWMNEHPEYLKNQLFIGADSYSGITAPIVVQHILEGNDAGDKPWLNLKGCILGCPRTDVIINENSKTTYSHRIGLISDELYMETKTSCKGNYYEVDPNQAECFENLNKVAKLINDINNNNILEPKCTWASPEQNGESDRRSLEQEPGNFIFSPPKIPEMWCHNFNYALSYVWANDDSVQQALYVRKGTVRNWLRCDKNLDYIENVASVLDLHRNLTSYGLQVLIYNGDHDLTVPNTGTQDWIKLLNLTVVNNWRPWLVDGEVAGYTIKYSEHGYGMTYATVLGAGHVPQEYKRRQCYEMFERWIHYYPL